VSVCRPALTRAAASSVTGCAWFLFDPDQVVGDVPYHLEE
jgi:hypothetical protein